MQRKSRSIALVLFLTLSVLSWSGSLLFAQAPIPTPQELDQLLAPVALYPDSLLAQITTASTNPQEILDVSNWLQANPGLQGAALTDAAEKQGFDSAFVALVMFPDVINMMAEDVDDFAAIGEAFTADQGAVSASIQRLRAQAYAAGTLQSNQQQTVEVQQVAAQPVYVIQPANPQVVYVPIYNPTTVYVRSPTVVVVSYGPPIPIGRILIVSTRPWGWMGWGWNWSSQPGLLQSHHLGGMASSLSSAELLVPSAPGPLFREAGIWRQLELSPTELSAADTSSSSGESSCLGTK